MPALSKTARPARNNATVDDPPRGPAMTGLFAVPAAPTAAHLATWLISAGTVAAVMLRPRRLSEALWATAGAALLVAAGLVSWPSARKAIGLGTDVYLFLAGMMWLAELARREGVFDYLAALAVRHAAGSAPRLFFGVYGLGVLVTVFMSNDATAVVLTPAVCAITR